MTDVKRSREVEENLVLPVKLVRVTSLVMGQRWSRQAYPWRDTHRVP